MLGYCDHIAILKYDLGTNCLSLIDVPLSGVATVGSNILVAMEDDILGFAHVSTSTLHLWSRQTGSNGVGLWTQVRAINLKKLLPTGKPKERRIRLMGTVESSGIIFMTTGCAVYEINIKSLWWEKIWKRANFHAFIPYMSFYNPQGISISIFPFFCDLIGFEVIFEMCSSKLSMLFQKRANFECYVTLKGYSELSIFKERVIPSDAAD